MADGPCWRAAISLRCATAHKSAPQRALISGSRAPPAPAGAGPCARCRPRSSRAGGVGHRATEGRHGEPDRGPWHVAAHAVARDRRGVLVSLDLNVRAAIRPKWSPHIRAAMTVTSSGPVSGCKASPTTPHRVFGAVRSGARLQRGPGLLACRGVALQSDAARAPALSLVGTASARRPCGTSSSHLAHTRAAASRPARAPRESRRPRS